MSPAAEGLRKRRVNYFVQIDRHTVRNTKLSYRALGLLTYLLDMPEGWDVKSEVLAAGEGREGREAVRTALRELAKHGYYRLERRRLLDGRNVMGTAISELPVDSWVADAAEYDNKAVPVVQQADGTFRVKHKDGTLTDDGFEDAVDPDEDPTPPGGGERLTQDQPATEGGEAASVTGDGFPGAGSPGAGLPDSGFPGALKEKEKGDREEENPSASLRSTSAEQPVLIPDETPANPEPETPLQQAYRIVRAYLDFYEGQTKAPVMNRTKVVEILRKSYVTPALETGATEDQIKRALANSHSEMPSMPVWRRVLREAMGGTNLAPVSQFQTREAYSNDKTWGTEEERAAEAERRKNMSQEEIDAEVAAALAPRPGRRTRGEQRA